MRPAREWITMPDGIRLAADLYLPEGPGLFAALLEALPYRKDDLTASYSNEYRRLVAEGHFTVCRVDLRGMGSSDGIALDEYPDAEQRDFGAVIAWLAGQAWSNGRVGMFGTSYSGFNSIGMACERPPALHAICAIYATDDRYTDDVHYMGGALRARRPRRLLPLHDPDERTPAGAGRLRAGLAGRLARTGRAHHAVAPAMVARATRRAVLALRLTPARLRSSYLRHDARGRLGRRLPQQLLRTFEALRCPKSLLMGPWSHMSTATSLPGPHLDLVPEMIR